MKKKWLLFISIAMLNLTACSNVNSNEVIQESNEGESSSITVNSLDDRHPNMIISEDSSKNSLIIGNSTKDPLDRNQFENGLMNIGAESFGKDTYLLADNTVLLESEKISDLLANNLISLLMYNYYDVNNSNATLSGVVIGIQMSSTYSNSQLSSKATEVAKEILAVLREDKNIADTPVVFAVFKQRSINEPISTAASGNFVLKSEATTTSTLGEWQHINESFYLYPSANLTSSRGADAKKIDNLVSSLSKKISSHDHIGVSGTFMYANDELQRISLTFTVRFNSKMQIAATVAAISELVADLPNNFDLEIILNSDSQSEALIVRNKDEDTFTHIY